jgi:DUF1680 family protein
MSQYHPIRFVNVRLEGDFWKERLDTVLARTIPSQHKKLAEYGNARLAEAPQPAAAAALSAPCQRLHRAGVLGFSDVGKWIEAASLCAGHKRDADIEAKIEAIVDDFEKAQAPDGYLNCWYLGREPDKRWSNLRDNHELYNAGHMLEGAIAYYETTGRRRWLDIMERYVDHIRQTFGTGPGQKRGYCGHQEIELALIKLYYLTGDRKAPRPRRLLHQRARQPQPALFRRRARGAREEAADSKQRYVQGTTNTASRTSRCASRTRWSGTRCAPCTCIRRWPTSPSSSMTRR